MKIESIRLKNFKVFREMEIAKLPKICVFIGANATGKTTLFQVFSFLKHAITDNVSIALSRLGGNKGFQEVRSRGAQGAIEIEIKFREDNASPLVSYLLCILKVINYGVPDHFGIKVELLGQQEEVR